MYANKIRLPEFNRNSLTPYQVKYIVYHAHCVDGLTSAAIAYDWDRFSKRYEYIAMDAGKTPEFVLNLESENILFIDVAPKREEFDKLIANSNKVLIMDHHETNIKALHDIPDENKFFRMDASGAMLAFIYFYLFRNYPNYRTILDSLDYVDDETAKYFNLEQASDHEFYKQKIYHFAFCVQEHDLFNVKKQDMFNIGLKTPYKADHLFAGLCSKLNHILDSNVKIPMVASYMMNTLEIIELGKMEQEANANYIESVVKSSHLICFTRHSAGRCFVLLSAESFRLCSEIGVKALEKFPKAPFSALVYPAKKQTGELELRVSLRSRPGFDVAVIAQRAGGGGHACAAGFSVDINASAVNKIIDCYVPKFFLNGVQEEKTNDHFENPHRKSIEQFVEKYNLFNGPLEKPFSKETIEEMIVDFSSVYTGVKNNPSFRKKIEWVFEKKDSEIGYSRGINHGFTLQNPYTLEEVEEYEKALSSKCGKDIVLPEKLRYHLLNISREIQIGHVPHVFSLYYDDFEGWQPVSLTEHSYNDDEVQQCSVFEVGDGGCHFMYVMGIEGNIYHYDGESYIRISNQEIF